MLHADVMQFRNPSKSGPRTGVGDVETSARHGVVSLELQTENVVVAGEVGRHLCPGETAKHRRVKHLSILHGQDVVWSLQVKVIEGQVDTAAGL